MGDLEISLVNKIYEANLYVYEVTLIFIYYLNMGLLTMIQNYF